MPLASIAALFPNISQQGSRLYDGSEGANLIQQLFSAQSAIVAKAGGGQAGATPLISRWNRIDTCATDADSVALPFAIPGAVCYVENNTAHTLQVFGQAANPANGNVGDTIAAHDSVTQQATATGVAQLTTVPGVYVCCKLGQWKQMLG